MSKCKPSCCSDTSSSAGVAPVFGLIVVALAIYGIIRAIWHLVIEIIEITAITLGSILAAVVLVVVAVHVARWHCTRRKTTARPKLVSLDPASPPVIAASGPGKPAQDTAELFADAIANDMDPRFVERILNAALERHDR
jgi:hypothetical protein